jgi:hypothetical protein
MPDRKTSPGSRLGLDFTAETVGSVVPSVGRRVFVCLPRPHVAAVSLTSATTTAITTFRALGSGVIASVDLQQKVEGLAIDWLTSTMRPYAGGSSVTPGSVRTESRCGDRGPAYPAPIPPIQASTPVVVGTLASQR